jgi:hypothetical protein
MVKNGFYTLASLTDEWSDDNSLHHFWHKGLKWAIRGLKRIRMDVHQNPKCGMLDVTERKTVTLPDDFVDYCIIAAKKGQYAITLAVNEELISSKRTDDEQTVRGLFSQNLPNGTDFSAYGGYSLFGSNGVYSVGGGLPSKGHIKIVDHGSVKEILLDYDYPFSQVYIEYITDGINPCGETYVHPYEYDYLLAFMDMMYEKKNNPKATLGSKRELEIDVEVEERKLRARFNDLTPKDILTMSRAEARFTTKL